MTIGASSSHHLVVEGDKRDDVDFPIQMLVEAQRHSLRTVREADVDATKQGLRAVMAATGGDGKRQCRCIAGAAVVSGFRSS